MGSMGCPDTLMALRCPCRADTRWLRCPGTVAPLVDLAIMEALEDTGREGVIRLNQSHFTRAWPPWPNRTTSTTGDLPTCNTTIGWCSERMGPPTSFRCDSAHP